MSFTSPVSLANRALQHVGINRILSLTDQSSGAQEIAACYDNVRQAELRRNLWVFATRKVALRALDTTSSLIGFPTWSAGFTYVDGTTGYPAGSVVNYAGQNWVSLINANTATPGVLPAAGSALAWDSYFGSLVANAWNDSIQNTDTTNNTSYHAGELVYMMTGSAAGNVYASIVEGNQNEPDVVDAWSDTTLYAGTMQVVSYNGTNYQNTSTLNFNNQPPNASFWTTTVTAPLVSNSWIRISSAVLNPNAIVYPLTAGPSSDASTRNAFMLPAGFLRPAPQSPKYGAAAFLGAHVGLPASDWVYEGKYITSNSYRTELMLRFIADVTDVVSMDPMFCEGLAARIAKEIAPRIDPTKAALCQQAYQLAMSEARTVDAIEAGAVEQEECEYISCRI